MRNERAVVRTVSMLATKQRRLRVRRVWLLVAAAVCVASAAGANLWTVRAPIDVPAGVSAAAAPRSALPREALAAPVIVRHPPVTPPADLAPGDKQRLRSDLASEPSGTAAALFSQANELRRTGRDDQAMQTYRKLQRLFPETPQADQSHATLGLLLLQRLSADEALTQFDRYLAHEGPLTEDVLVGRALALQRLGRGHEERKTWEILLHHFPSSVHAIRAKIRLAELPTVVHDLR
jgi:TolA-binding protein